MDTVRKVIDLGPCMVRIYPTVVVKGSELHGMYLRGEYRPLSLEEAIPLCAGMLLSFRKEGIPVIRLGLQQTPRLGEGGVIAGPHHPALRHLVESHIHLRLAQRALRSVNARGGEAFLSVSPANLSNLRGQKNHNITSLLNSFSLRRLEVKTPPDLADDTMRLEWEGLNWEGRTGDLLTRDSI
jgi:histone acetyltransferase (RNA polymerase elongator complex component)